MNSEVESQDKTELQAMADYYATEYGEVYFVRCLKCQNVIAVEGAPANESKPGSVDRALGRRNIFGYQGRFLTTRQRLDTNSSQHQMIGYECICGNDTRIGDSEKGIVRTSRTPTVLSPFERAQIQAKLLTSQESNADYEVGVDADGYIFERFESFMVVRVK